MKTPQTPDMPAIEPENPLVSYKLITAQQASSSKPTPSPSYPSRQLDILLHNGDSFGMYGAQVRVLEQMNQKRF